VRFAGILGVNNCGVLAIIMLHGNLAVICLEPFDAATFMAACDQDWNRRWYYDYYAGPTKFRSH